MRKKSINNCLVALLFWGSAISLLSCQDHTTVTNSVSRETLMSESSDSLTVMVSENGRPSYRFTAPLVEGYSLAREPYREFRKGIEIITYLDDTVKMVDAILTSNYAINYSNLKLWEAKGDVVVVKHDGKNLYTQQLFWNSTTQRIYSNVDTKIVDTVTGDVYTGEGFESDEEMKQWSFRKMKGRMKVDTSPNTEPDSMASAEPVVAKEATAKSAPPKEDQIEKEETKQIKKVEPIEAEELPVPAAAATAKRKNTSSVAPKAPSRPTPPTPQTASSIEEVHVEEEPLMQVSDPAIDPEVLLEKEK